jgi:hypothetical protein
MLKLIPIIPLVFLACNNGSDPKIPEIFTINFDIGYKTDIQPPSPITVMDGTSAGDLFPANPAPRPTEHGVDWTFAGWYDYATVYDKDSLINKNLNLRAKYSFQNTGNPLIRHKFTADPSALVVGDTVYLYTGHDEKRDEDTEFIMQEWLCFSSKDMITWVDHGPIMHRNLFSAWNRQSPPFTELQTKVDAWAAHMAERKGLFYFYVTQTMPTGNGTDWTRGIGVAVGPSPVGPFEDALGRPLVNGQEKETQEWGTSKDIDPAVWINPRTEQAYLLWGNPSSEFCFIAKLTNNMTSYQRPIQRIQLQFYTEGPWMWERGDFLYLMYPSHNHQVGGSERMSYSYLPKNEDPITGNWIWGDQIANSAQNSFTIHPAVIELNGQAYLFYHNAALTLVEDGITWGPNIGRRSVCLDYLFYNSDGTIQFINQTRDGVTVPPVN